MRAFSMSIARLMCLLFNVLLYVQSRGYALAINNKTNEESRITQMPARGAPSSRTRNHFGSSSFKDDRIRCIHKHV